MKYALTYKLSTNTFNYVKWKNQAKTKELPLNK